MSAHNTALANEPSTGEESFTVREAVAIFASERDLADAIDALERDGFDRADISVLGPAATIGGPVARSYAGALALAEDGNVPRAAQVSYHSLVEAEAAAIGLPVYVGAVGGLFAVVATGGTLAFAIPVALAGGLAGGAIGALGATAISSWHRGSIEKQLSAGGLLVWVRTRSDAHEARAQDVLRKAGGRNVHVHEVLVHWHEDAPFAHVQPDPFLERGPDYD